MVKRNKQKMYIGIGALFVIALILGSSALSGNILSGYGGMTAEIINVRDGSNRYTAPIFDFVGQTRIGGTYAQVDPLGGGIFQPDPTGIRMELSSRLRPIYEASKVLGNIEKPILDDGGVQIGEERVTVKIVPMVMGITVRTYGVGDNPIIDIIFTVRIQENDFSYFGDADEAMAYIVAVYLIDPPQTTHDQNIQVSPSTGGAEPSSSTHGTNPVPAWINEAAGEISYNIPSQASVVHSEFVVTKAVPNLAFLAPREENEATWNVGVDVLIFGKWSVEGELPDFDPKDAPNILDEFFNSVGNLVGGITMSLVILGVIAFAILVVVFIIMRGLKGGGGKKGKSGAGSGYSGGGSSSGQNWT